MPSLPRPGRCLVPAAFAGVIALVLSSCSSNVSGTGSHAGTPSASSSSGSASPAVSSSSASPSAAASTLTVVQTTAAAPPAATSKAPAGASVSYFKVTQQPSCPIVATSDAPYGKPGSDIVVSWSVSGASQVALSLDDAGFYAKYGTGSLADYPATGSAELSFQCDPTVQPNTTHVYYLNTVSKPTVLKTITVTVPTSP